jgi:REP element-mobilizing transposase RayT
MARKAQVEMLKKQKDSYGGELRKTREGRLGPRPIATKHTMHLVLRSSKAVKDWSFKKSNNEHKIKKIVQKFSEKYGVKVYSIGNAGNHLHFQIKLGNRYTYKPFIRAITSAIAMSMTGASRWKSLDTILAERNLSPALKRQTKASNQKISNKKFWDYRPFTRIVQSFRAFLNLRDYIEINQLEGFGCDREDARMIVHDAKIRPWKYQSG